MSQTHQEVFAHPVSHLDPIRCEAILGPAGSGKSYMLKQRLAEDEKYAILSATTGIAAMNLGPAVSTIHSTLGFYNLQTARENFHSITNRFYDLAFLAKAIVLDEISMCSAELLDVLFRAYCLACEKIRMRNPDSQFAFVVTGDFCQLPPVEGKYAFEAECWPFFAENLTQLRTIYRQSDPKFLEAMQAAREGKGISCAKALSEAGVKFVPEPDYNFPGTTIYPVNASVDKHNRLIYDSIDAEELSVSKICWGKQKAEWKEIPDVLRLKLGTRVMALANNKAGKGGYLYVNGSLGTVAAHYALGDTFTVKFDPRPGEVEEAVEGEGAVTVQRVCRTWKVKKMPQGALEWEGPDMPPIKAPPVEFAKYFSYYDKYAAMAVEENRPYITADQEAWIIGYCDYVPLRMAYALTCHKSQGLTLDRVQVDLRSLMAGKDGLAYVALSRATNPAGVQIVGNPTKLAQRVISSPKVRAFI